MSLLVMMLPSALKFVSRNANGMLFIFAGAALVSVLSVSLVYSVGKNPNNLAVALLLLNSNVKGVALLLVLHRYHVLGWSLQCLTLWMPRRTS